MEQDEDEERIAERAIEANGGILQKVFPVWSQAARDRIAERGSLSPDVLLVAAGDFACDLVHDGVAAGGISLNPLGALAVAGVTAKGLTLEPSADDDACVVHDLGGGVVVAAARHRNPGRVGAGVGAVPRERGQTRRVVVLCAVDEHDVGYGVDGYRGSFVLDTAAQRSGMHSLSILDDADVPAARTLPAGALLEGVPAAVAARCEMLGIPARVVAVPAPTGSRDGRARSRTARGGPGARRIGVGPGFGGRRRPRRVARGPPDAEGVRDRFRGVGERVRRGGGGRVVEEADVGGGGRRHAGVHVSRVECFKTSHV